MKLSAYAKAVGVTSKTAYQWWKVGQLDASQLPTGTISVHEAQPRMTGVALSACASSAEQQDDLTRQAGRLRDYAAARGSHVVAEVTEIASGLNEERPKRTQLLTDHKVGVIVVEQQGRRVEALFPTDSGDELVNDFVAVITSLAGRRADAGLCQAG